MARGLVAVFAVAAGFFATVFFATGFGAAVFTAGFFAGGFALAAGLAFGAGPAFAAGFATVFLAVPGFAALRRGFGLSSVALGVRAMAASCCWACRFT